MKKRFRIFVIIISLMIMITGCTSCKPDKVVILPSVTSNSASAVTRTSAVLNGTVTADGGGSITSRGFYLSNYDQPGSETTLYSGSGMGDFSYSLDNLEPNTLYQYKSFAINETGESLGQQKSFQTTANRAVVISTKEVTGLTTTSAISGGNITDVGDNVIVERGVVVAKGHDPTVADDKFVDSSGNNDFQCTIDNRSPNTAYGVRSYSKNGEGTIFYGETKTFTTLKEGEIEISSTSNITMTSANITISVTANSSTISEAGICYVVGNNTPTINDNKVIGANTGGSIAMTGLAEGTYHNVRAYIVIESGVVYTNTIGVTTLAFVNAEVGINSYANLLETSVDISYFVNKNDATINEVGICYVTDGSDPTINDNKVIGDSNEGTISLSGLVKNTKHYMCIYADTDNGVQYSSTVLVWTYEGMDAENKGFHTTTIGTQVWMIENVSVTHYQNGDEIPEVTDNASWAWTTGISTGARCYYDNDKDTYNSKYGALYNWHAANDSRSIFPVGYGLPTEKDYAVLNAYLASNVGGKMKSTSSNWQSPNTGATNSSEFTAEPAGGRGQTATGAGVFLDEGTDAIFWTSSHAGNYGAQAPYLSYNRDDLTTVFFFDKSFGFSVRGILKTTSQGSNINAQVPQLNSSKEKSTTDFSPLGIKYTNKSTK